MKKGIIALMACVFAMCLALVGCAGGSGGDPKAAWVGTWDLHEMTNDGEQTSAEDIDMLRSLGLDVYLELNDDGTASLALFGESTDGTWEGKDATNATLTMGGDSIDLRLDGDQLLMEQGEASLTFVKGEQRGSSDAASSEGSSSSSGAAD